MPKDMERLAQEIRATEAAQELAARQEDEARQQARSAEEQRRVARLSSMTNSWFSAMVDAGYPGATTKRIRERKVVRKGPFGIIERNEIEDRDVAGWSLGEHAGGSYPDFSTQSLFLCADGQLLSARDSEIWYYPHEFGGMRSEQFSKLEDAVPEVLHKIARENGVGWSFSG